MQLKKSLIYLLVLSLPIVLFLLLAFFVIPTKEDLIRDSFNFIISGTLLYSFSFLFPSVKLRQVASFCSFIFLSLLLLIKLSFYYTYKTKLSASALFVIFETNAQEASSFIEVYINKFLIIVSIVVILLWLFVYRFLFIRRNDLGINEFSKLFRLLLRFSFAGIVLLCLYLIPWKFSDYNLIYKAQSSYKDYKKTKSLIKKDLAKKKSPFLNNVEHSEYSPETIVVIIGESTANTHMSLYGYYRNTNPKLSSLEDELLVFKDIITPHVHTITALNEIMTLSSNREDRENSNASIVQLANEAGYNTYWISNQRPVGIYESIPTLISYGANHKTFLNTNDYNRQSFDEVVLPDLQKALQGNEKKAIFIHLSGTHVGYAERYPENFEYFKTIPETPYKYQRAYNLINEYDNAIRYNDSIIYEIISEVKKKEESASVMYFSDHGDDVFEVQENAGHNEYLGTYPMYKVPLIFWMSEQFKENIDPWYYNFRTLENRPYMLDDLIHSFAEINQIKFEGFLPQKSIFNKNFVSEKRSIKENEFYEERFKK